MVRKGAHLSAEQISNTLSDYLSGKTYSYTTAIANIMQAQTKKDTKEFDKARIDEILPRSWKFRDCKILKDGKEFDKARIGQILLELENSADCKILKDYKKTNPHY
jgi:hypothetical protein